MQIPTLGQTPADNQERDAVHIAIIPITASEQLKPGQRVRLSDEGKAVGAVGAWTGVASIGVVDPFRDRDTMEGERFWLLLTPGTITSLRHEWEHPAFPIFRAVIDEAERAASEKWLREFADEHRIEYQDLVAGAVSGEGAHFGDETPDEVRHPGSEFWTHVENVAGVRLSEDHRENTFFSCGC